MLLWGPVTLHQPPVDYPERDEADDDDEANDDTNEDKKNDGHDLVIS